MRLLMRWRRTISSFTSDYRDCGVDRAAISFCASFSGAALIISPEYRPSPGLPRNARRRATAIMLIVRESSNNGRGEFDDSIW